MALWKFETDNGNYKVQHSCQSSNTRPRCLGLRLYSHTALKIPDKIYLQGEVGVRIRHHYCRRPHRRENMGQRGYKNYLDFSV